MNKEIYKNLSTKKLYLFIKKKIIELINCKLILIVFKILN